MKTARRSPGILFTAAQVLGFVAATAYLLIGVSCKTPVSVADPGPKVVQAVKDCGYPAVRDLAAHLLDDVTSALLATGDWRAALAAVVARSGLDGALAVKCAVAQIFKDTSEQLALKAQMDQPTAYRTQLLNFNAATYLTETK